MEDYEEKVVKLTKEWGKELFPILDLLKIKDNPQKIKGSIPI